MSIAQKNKERIELGQFLQGKSWNIFGTLKFVNGRTIGRVTADKLLRSYWNRVDLTFFGKAAERQNVRVPRWCFAHEGSDSENFHIHFVALAPLADIEFTCAVFNAVWAQHHRQTATLTKNWIMPVLDRSDVMSYLKREYWRMGSDTLLPHISCDESNSVDMAKYEHERQADRIRRAASPLWLRQATQALALQQAEYQANHSSVVS